MVASARRGQRHRARCSALVITATTVATLIIPVRAHADSRPVILETKPLQKGRAFECRIPVQIRYEGNIPLRSIRVIAKAYDESEELTSTGVSSGTAIIPRISGNAVRYAPVPMQFDLSEDACEPVTSDQKPASATGLMACSSSLPAALLATSLRTIVWIRFGLNRRRRLAHFISLSNLDPPLTSDGTAPPACRRLVMGPLTDLG